MITTFYSFKGGVGRTFLALEAAAQLAARGLSVAFWDLDLEAPGLQLHPALAAVQKDLKRGTFDLLEGWKDGKEIGADDLRRCLLPVTVPDALPGGKLAFLFPSVLHDDTEYAARLSTLDFEAMFAPEGEGPAFFDRVAGLLDRDLGYQHVIIDSRTGYTDLGAVCTIGLPDAVVLVAGVSEQNLHGLTRVAAAVQSYEKHDKARAIDLRVVLNKVPDSDQLTARQLKALRARLSGLALKVHHQVGLYPGRFGDDAVPSLLADGAREPDVTRQRAQITEIVDDLDGLRRSREQRVESAEGPRGSRRARGRPPAKRGWRSNSR